MQSQTTPTTDQVPTPNPAPDRHAPTSTDTDSSPRRRLVVGAAIAAVVLLVAPPALRLVAPETARELQGVTAADVDTTPVVFTNDVDDLTLGGQLFVPDTSGPHPAVALINGSGASRRDNSWYLTMGAHLADNGFVVLWPDKRGSEASEGDGETAGFEALARDAAASLDHLRTLPEVDPERVGVIGMSQGGRIASIVAAEEADLAFAVSFVGGVLPAHASLRYEETHNLREMGFLPGVSDVLARASAWSITSVRQSEFWDAVGDFDPLPYWAEVEVPVLFQFGTVDTNTDTRGSVERLGTIARPGLRIEVYDGSGHALQEPPHVGDALIRPEALADLTTFVAEATG